MKNNSGSDQVPWEWFLSRLKGKKGRLLDFGSGPNAAKSRLLVEMGFKVVSVDLQLPQFERQVKKLSYVQGDMMDIELKEKSFDIILNLSSVEHAGLAGRYESKDEVNQDLEIMALLSRLLKDDGIHLLAIPVGIDSIIGFYHRVYGKLRLPYLLDKWSVVEQLFWKKEEGNIYLETDEKSALKEIPSGPEEQRYYAMGAFVLEQKEKI